MSKAVWLKMLSGDLELIVGVTNQSPYLLHFAAHWGESLPVPTDWYKQI